MKRRASVPFRTFVPSSWRGGALRCLVSLGVVLVVGCAEPEAQSSPTGQLFSDTRGEAQACGEGLGLLFELTTDSYAFETAWKIEGPNGWEIGGPPAGRKYADDTVYRGRVCVPGPGDYVLTITDTANDGICCGYGQGSFRLHRDDTLLAEGGEFGDEITVPFRMGADRSCRDLTLEMTFDKYSAETGWDLVSVDDGGGETTIASAPVGEYRDQDEGATVTAYEACVPDGTYELVVRDSFGDGMCCREGEGAWRLRLDGELKLQGGKFSGKRETHRFHFPTAALSPADEEWLSAHNRMRRKYHEEYGYTYVPLEWSEGLEDSSREYATTVANNLTDRCRVQHEAGNPYGENAGATTPYWNVTPTRMVEGRFVGQELGRTYPGSGHLTNVLWRATKYVGCADAIGAFINSSGQEQKCTISVCRYAKPGNCGIGSYHGQMWFDIPDMWMDDTGCLPDEGPDGHPF